jgi:hypothetical protein
VALSRETEASRTFWCGGEHWLGGEVMGGVRGLMSPQPRTHARMPACQHVNIHAAPRAPTSPRSRARRTP